MTAKGIPWRSWVSLVILISVSLGIYARSWRHYDLHLSLTEQHEELLVLPTNRTTRSADADSNISGQVDNGRKRARTNNANNRQAKAPVSDTPEYVEGGAFVHIGKTGGSTLTRYLRNACHSYVPKPCGVIPNETIISKLITDYYHVPDFFRLPRKIHSFYLLSLRDPFERTVSGFVFGHPTNAKVLGEGLEFWKRKRGGYFQPKCFGTLEQFVENLGEGNFSDYDYPYLSINIVQDNCTDFARAMLDAKIKRMSHLFYNYQKLHSMMPWTTTMVAPGNATLSLYATRNEHLLDDFARINQLFLGENAKLDDTLVLNQKTRVRDVSNITLPVTRELSDQGRQRLCRALEPEYRVYVNWLQHAKNLNPNDVMEALEYSRKQCPDLELLSSA